MSRILVVEDSLTQAEQVRFLLEEKGFTVEVASDAEQALVLLAGAAFDLVITDIVMPGMSGYELCRRIKDHPLWRQTPVILLTTLNDPLDILQGIECGADNYVTKPYQGDALLARVRYIFTNRPRRSEGRLEVGVEVAFRGRTVTVTSEKEQVLDLLLATCEDVVRANRDLRASQTELLQARKDLEARVRARTAELAEANAALTQEVEERRRAELRLSAQHAVTSVLAESASLEEAAPLVLRAIGERLDWACGGMWTVDRQAGLLQRVVAWHVPSPSLVEFQAIIARKNFTPGEGLLGRVWAAGAPVWMADLRASEDFLRKAAAERAGLRSALAFPILRGREVLGVIEFFGRDVRQPDPELLQTMAAAGSQVGQFIERKQAEASLNAEREFLKAVLENAQDGIVACDAQGVLSFFNRAARELHGQGERPLPAEQWAQQYDLYHADGKTLLAKEELPLFRALRGEEVRNAEVVVSPPGKPTRTVWASGQAIRGPGGETLGAVAVMHDATERLRLEQQLRQSQKMEAVGRLAGGIAHDFNNLLTVINGYSEALLGGARLDDPGEMVSEIEKAGQRAAAMTRQLLAFSRQEVVVPMVLDLNVVIANVEKMLRRVIGEDVALVCSLTPGLGRVKADPGQLEQVLLNLVVNARDAMPKGGKLTIETANAELDADQVRLRPELRPGRHVLLAVSDTGCGMDDATKARLFEPFFTTKGPGKGTGLGLATVYGVIQQSGGGVWVYSESGRGTTFKVYLPRVEEEVSAKVEPGPPRNASGTETLLLVEDEDAVRALARQVLQMSGYTVLEARDGLEAVRVCAAHPGPISLLVTDVVMPGLGGRELADRLLACRPGLKVLYLSGYTDDAVVRHGVLEAEVEFLQKPFTVAELRRKVREVLDAASAPS